jgi:hypothetical protein
MTVPMPDGSPARPTPWVRSQLVTGWVLVGIPLVYGVYETLLKAAKLF